MFKKVWIIIPQNPPQNLLSKKTSIITPKFTIHTRNTGEKESKNMDLNFKLFRWR